ncbi:C-type lectin domain family 17, member A-like [Pelmatolapia mariae]|uniref:C-type lectin domain family 17, member A-like n=1 Tax=Pelmatolapia mariae TaxID=158779 RepID=UPI002FE52196
MKEISANSESAEQDNPKPSTHHTGPKSCKGNRYLDVIVFWSLLGVLLLTRFVTHGVHYFIMIEERDSLNANLSTVSKKLAVMTEERDLLRANLSENLKELEGLLSLYKQKKTCPAGWSKFNHSCYLLSERSGSWDAARRDCRDRGADLVVINSPEEQTFLSTITTENAWIGLNDKEQEGTWKWVDGTPLTLMYWATTQPDNGGKQDCAYVRKDERRSWDDDGDSTIAAISSLKALVPGMQPEGTAETEEQIWWLLTALKNSLIAKREVKDY